MELLEREPYLETLNVALKQVASGQGRMVLISGEAGIGKTSLVERFAQTHRNTARIVWGACDDLFTPRPLGPLHDLAHQIGGEVLRLLESEANRATLFSAFLSELSGPRPTIAVFEDVHWADEATLLPLLSCFTTVSLGYSVTLQL